MSLLISISTIKSLCNLISCEFAISGHQVQCEEINNSFIKFQEIYDANSPKKSLLALTKIKEDTRPVFAEVQAIGSTSQEVKGYAKRFNIEIERLIGYQRLKEISEIV